MYITGKQIIGRTIIIKENEELKIENATLLFEKDVGIFCEGRFNAINSTFKPNTSQWKNISLIGKVRSSIENCRFIKGTGMEIKHIKDKFISRFYPFEDTEILENWNENDTQEEIKECYETKIGGALLCLNTEIRNCHFLDCSAIDGGSIYATFNCNISHCLFENSYSGDAGGAVYLHSGDIKNSKFYNCTSLYHGGALALNKYASAKRCYFLHCKSIQHDGGAIDAKEMNKIQDCLFKYCTNRAVRGGSHILNSRFNFCDGGVYLENGSVKHSQFYRCKSKNSGGGIFVVTVVDTMPTITHCNFTNCSSKSDGGGIRANNTFVNDCIFKNCKASKLGNDAYLSESFIKNSKGKFELFYSDIIK